MMARFRQDYLDLLDGRVATIERLVTQRETERTQVALLSLESSSAMVGASELADAVRRLRLALDTAAPEEEIRALTSQMLVTADEAVLQMAEQSE